MKTQSTTITGMARNGKEGALLVAENDSVYYIDGLESWDAEYEGKKVKVTGIIEVKSVSPEDLQNEKGEWSAGVSGDYKIIKEAKWIGAEE